MDVESTINGITKYQHIEKLKNTSVEGLLQGDIWIQEKIDGSNMSVAWDEVAGDLIILSRNQVVYNHNIALREITDVFDENEFAEQPSGFRLDTLDPKSILFKAILNKAGKGWRKAVELVASGDYRKYFAKHPAHVLRGEWLVPHQVKYETGFYREFYIFDVQDRADNNRYIPYEEYSKELDNYEFCYIPAYGPFKNPDADLLKEWLEKPSELKSEYREGIVIKNYDYTNRYGRMQWGKAINEKHSKKTEKIPQKVVAGDLEQEFVDKFINMEFVVKEIKKIEFEQGKEVEIKQMAKILGICVHTVWQEEAWSYLLKKNPGEFNFRVWHKATQDKIRTLALEYFNGL